MQISSKNPLVYIGFWCIIALIFTNFLPEIEDDTIPENVEDSPRVSLLKEKATEMRTLKKTETNDDIF